jgi:hypothetical protein
MPTGIGTTAGRVSDLYKFGLFCLGIVAGWQFGYFWGDVRRQLKEAENEQRESGEGAQD